MRIALIVIKLVSLRYISLCHKHCTPKPQMTGVVLISKDDEARQKQQGEGNGLWNAQLFPPPALVPVPECAHGAARAEDIQVENPKSLLRAMK